MVEKKAFVFDTNFIFQNKKLDEVIENLKSEYTVYITQVSIDERIAQHCRELKNKFGEIEKCREKYGCIAQVSLLTTYEKEAERYRSEIQANYESYFGGNIIPFSKDANTFDTIIERANRKIPPFSNAKDASDKGFKDCLLWISLLEYFKDNGENQVVFVTDDRSAFGNHADFLKSEFERITGKIIEFKPNAFYNELLIADKKEQIVTDKGELPDMSQIRDKINDVVFDLCIVETVDGWGNPCWESTFTLSQKVDADYMKVIFGGLYNDINRFIFNKFVSAENVFALDDRLINGMEAIPMEALESAYRLHEEIKRKFPDYLTQFYGIAAEIFNTNYVEPTTETTETGFLPF